MVNENLINLTINKNKPVELVQELKDYEIKKSSLSPAAQAKVIKMYGGNYRSPRMDGEDFSVMQMYGPGFWEGVWTVTKKVGGFALAVSYATPIAPVTLTASLAAAGTAHLMKEYGGETERKIANEIGDVLTTAVDTQDLGSGAANTYSNYKHVTRR